MGMFTWSEKSSATLAGGGVIGPTKPYEGRLGLFNTHLKDLAKAVDYAAITRELGAGGMATVYLAEDLKHQRSVAVKVLDPHLAARDL